MAVFLTHPDFVHWEVTAVRELEACCYPPETPKAYAVSHWKGEIEPDPDADWCMVVVGKLAAWDDSCDCYVLYGDGDTMIVRLKEHPELNPQTIGDAKK